MSFLGKADRRRKPFFLLTHSRPINFGQIMKVDDLRIGQFVYFHGLKEISVILILRIGKFKIDYVTTQVNKIIDPSVLMATYCEFGLEPYSTGSWGSSYLQESGWHDMPEKDVEFVLSNIENRIRTIME